MKEKIDNYAIVIGIDHYAQLPQLRNANKDATAFAKWLASPDGGRLSRDNIQLILSAPSIESDPLTAMPQSMHIDRALRNLGIESGRRVGQRLTFYFAGHSLVGANDDIGMVMADCSADNLGDSLSLQSYEQFFKETAPFTEVVFILDTHPIQDPGSPGFFRGPSFSLPRKRETFHDVAAFSIHSNLRGGEGDESGAYLTQAVLEGLDGKAAGIDDKITAATLADYSTARVEELAIEQNLLNPNQVVAELSGEIIFGEGPIDRETGKLLVELPHWTAVLRVYDSQFRQLPNVGVVEEVPTGSFKYQTKVDLPGGIFKVEVSLDDEVESQYILIHAGKTSRIKRGSWKTLVFTSAAPLIGTVTSRRSQMNQAEEKSLKPTWRDAPGGDSRLFLFLRTEYPAKYPKFFEGLRLLDQNGELVTDFSRGVKKNRRGGWLAFNADLPSGYYILRRGRSGVWLRHQPVYLCAGWETHIFLQAQNNFPSLSTMALDMSPLGTGFRADDATMAAAESVLGSLGQSSGGRGIAGSKRFKTLLDQKRDNPWLGILASYALLRSGSSEGSESAELLQHLLANLNESIGDHPDVRALHLNEELPAFAPFWNPPLLHAGLSRVQAHAVHFADTIPLDSLCDVALDNVILNTPWTAWRHLDRSPLLQDGVKAMGFDTLKSKDAASQVPSITQTISKSASPDLPIYQFSLTSEIDAQEDGVLDEPADAIPAERAGTIRQTALQQQVQTMVATTDFENRPESWKVNLSGDEGSLLDNVNPEDVSQASGMPLARAQRGLEGLKKGREMGSRVSLDERSAQKAFKADERMVQNYAIQKQATAYQKSIDFPLDKSTEEEEASSLLGKSFSVSLDEADQVLAEPKITIEGVTANLLTEAERLIQSGGRAGEAEASHMLAIRLQELSDSLLQRADYVIVTDLEGYITKSNGAFLSLISPEGLALQASSDSWESQSIKTDLQRRENRRIWEEAVRAAQADDKTMADPLQGDAGPEWEFKLTAVNDENGIQVASLYTFRQRGAPQLARNVLADIRAIIPDLTFNSSMFAYSSGEDAVRYLKNLDGLIFKMEEIVY